MRFETVRGKSSPRYMALYGEHHVGFIDSTYSVLISGFNVYIHFLT